ncbi:galactose oxidase [Rhizophagus irregularis]|uniref:Galactose oxidase n=1 Tax=Rhizophagus irregularis TaxID=588596 RepID=A0A2N0RVE8_9GLOM|nr:galactose oxidase [Rhizophagus irregularis]
MKYEINNITTQLGLYGSCVHDNINENFKLQDLENLFTCTKGGLIGDFGHSGTRFLGAMHPIGDILIFKDDNSQKEQFEQNFNKTTGGVISPNKNFGPGFGLAIAALIFMLISICLACRSRNLTVKINSSVYIVLWILIQLLVEINGQMRNFKPKFHDDHLRRYLHTATFINSNLYILGGRSNYDNDTGKQFFYYNFDAPLYVNNMYWNNETSINIVPSHRGAAAVNGGTNNEKLILYTGNSDNFTDPLIYSFDIRTNLWTSLKTTNNDIIIGKNQLQGVVDHKKKMYLFGGRATNNIDGDLNDMLILDTINLSWKKGNSINAPSPRRNYGATFLPNNNNIIYIGGVNGGDHLPLDEVYLYDTINDVWSKKMTSGKIPSKRDAFSAVLGLDGNRVIIFGGFGISSKDALYVLNLTNFEWKVPFVIGEIPASRYWHKANVISDYMVVTFGTGYENSNDSDVLFLDIKNNDMYEWSHIFDPVPSKSRVQSITPSTNNKNSSNKLVMIYSVIGSLIGGICLLVGIFILRKWNKNNKVNNIPDGKEEGIIAGQDVKPTN